MENDLKGIENYFELTGDSSYRGFESRPGVDCMSVQRVSILQWQYLLRPRKLIFLLFSKIKGFLREQLTSDYLST